MKIVFQLCALIVFLLAASEIAYSCSCFRIDNESEIEMTDVIFTGKVVEITQDTNYVPPKLESVSPGLSARISTRKRYLVRFKIDEVFKGAGDSEITLVQYETQEPLACPGLVFSKGKKYLVYASIAEGELWGGGICSRTQNFDKKSKDYKELRRLGLKSKNKGIS